MSEINPAVMVHDVKLSRLVFLVLLLPLLLLSGCHGDRYRGVNRTYSRVRITNPRGELISDYIAEGRVRSTERGYSFSAVERTTTMPYMMNVRYPRGRRIEVAGPNILVTRSGKPEWLYQVDGY
ncbi:MAG: hypothetical protein EOP84_28615 [Verrucomicrobiaceae bacterium]|nr:MAG: hypothetical protein EOP84_28615 [Verrucomicrobiaceae bacterium]